MAERDEGFLSRWSRRKAGVREDAVPDVGAGDAARRDRGDAAAPDAARADQSAAQGAAPPVQDRVVPNEPPSAAPPVGAPAAAASTLAQRAEPALLDEPARPTLDDVAKLTRDADFSSFVAREVDPEVRNAAMRKLFGDPHFNVMDGLDVYIDDYNKADPLPRQWLRQMMQARVLGLLDDEVEEQPLPPRGRDPEPEAIDAEPQAINDEPQAINDAPRAINDAPQAIEGDPQAIANEPHVLDDDPQALDDVPADSADATLADAGAAPQSAQHDLPAPSADNIDAIDAAAPTRSHKPDAA